MSAPEYPADLSGTPWHVVDDAPPPPEPDTEYGVVIPFNAKEMHTGQMRIAERFVKRFTDNLLYVHGHGWHYWSGTHWVEDEDGKVRRRVVTLLKEIRYETIDMQPKARDALLKDVKICESNGGVTGVLELAKHMHPMTVSVKAVNGNPFLFNALNGTLNLETGELQPHAPGNMITKCAGTEVVAGARDDLFDEFLDTVLPDEDVRSYLQRVFGVAMLGIVREHNLPILTGTGGNGKGVCYEAVLAAFGDYGMTVDPKLIMQSKHERHATFLADLHGARLVVTSETNEGEVIAASTVKRLTGGDKIRANRMRENTFEFTPSHSLLYITNHKPQVSADDKAMWRRLAIIPFDVTVEEPDVKLPEKLKERLPAVLAWVYQGWLDYQEQGLNPPEAVLERTETYRTESDPVGLYIAEECVTGSQYIKVKAKALYQDWQTWAMREGHPPITQTEFGTKIASMFEKKRGSAGWEYLGIALAAAEEENGGGLL